ncbi:hypothetical protein Hanom_Chr07g00612401 [Helianthus anomalus]
MLSSPTFTNLNRTKTAPICICVIQEQSIPILVYILTSCIYLQDNIIVPYACLCYLVEVHEARFELTRIIRIRLWLWLWRLSIQVSKVMKRLWVWRVWRRQ